MKPSIFGTDPRLLKVEYEPQTFKDMAKAPAASVIWKFLVRVDNVIRMETATALDRVAVEPLGKLLLEEFGVEIEDERTKQMIGHMARQIMYSLGYEVDRQHLRITRENLFMSGTSYRGKDRTRDTKMKISAESRQRWKEKVANSPFNKWMNSKVRDANGKLDLERLYALARKYKIKEEYRHLNPGQQRMSIGILLRGRVDTKEYEGLS